MTRTCLGAFAARVLAAKVGTAAFLLALAALLAAPMLAVAQVPGAPTNLTATADGQAAIDLEWDAPTATGGSTITGYKIEWSADGNDPWMVLVADTGSADTEYTDADSLMGGTTRHYRVSAINDEGPGTASTVASGTTDYQLLSPNGHVEVTIQLQDGSLHYSIDHRQEQLVTPSAVGMAFSEDLDDVGDVTIVGTDTRENDTTWTPVWGKTSEVTDHFRESSVSLQEVVPPQRVFDVVFRAYDDGVAFRYHVPSQTNLEDGDVLRERTYFNFAGNWPVHSVGRTEYPPGGPTPIDDFGSSNTPMLVLPDSGALAVHEAALLDYPVMHLMGSAENPHSVLAHVDSVTFSELLWTPWRVLLVASDLGRLLETQLLETLSPPSSIADTSFVRPGKAIFDRRIRKLTYGDVYYWFNTAAYIHMIDFAARNGIAYLAIDSNWYGVQRDPLSNPMTAVAGLDIEAVLAHAKNNGIRVILYVNDMAFDNYDMDEVFAKYREWGVGGVKYGFMRGNQRSEAKVVKTVAAIELAARHQLLIKFHDNPIHPTGLQRTYPNLVSVEYSHGQLDAVRTFTPEDYLRTIFVHMLAGPLDMNNGYFALDSIHTRTNGGLQYNRTYPQLYSTVTAETARILITDTGLTVLPDAPEEYERKDDLFEFVRRMPNAPWDDTRVLHAEFGVHVTTARRHGLEWFIGSVVNEDGGSLDIALDFLEAGVTYAATLYEDAEDTHYQTNREAYRVRQTTVVVGDTISAAMAPGGGHAIWLRPKTGPVFSGGDAFAVAENETFVGRVNAEDSGSRYRIGGYAIGGGADQSTFEIASTSGLLTFRTAPNFEDPQDADSNNTYVVVVRATSGAGAMELEAEQTFTVSVTDELEPPGIPEAPSFSGETAESLQVSWSKPDNPGPAITDYDVQYREKGTGRFSDGDHEGPGLTLTLTDLKPGTVYEVRVRAANDEGTSGWSDPGEGMTVTPLTVVMASGTEPPVSGPFRVRFSFSEPVTGFSASDIETGQDPACVDDQNNTVFCDPGIGGVQTADDRVFTSRVTPRTDGVADNYTLRLRVPADTVASAVGNKPNEEAMLEVRVATPGGTLEIGSLNLSASPGSGSVRLSWNRPSDNGGSAIIRYEVRYQAVGEAWSEWEKVGAGSRGVTVGNLINGREYIFEVSAVNALGKGGAETVQATPERRIAPPPGGGGGGGGGGLLFPPEAPAGLMAMPGEGAVRLEWSPPESDGGAPILRYEYRLKEGRGEFGEWTSIADSAPDEVNATGYTVGELGNGTVYVFELRAVNLVGGGRVSEAVEAVMGLDPAYWSNFGAEDLQGVEASLERGPFGGGPQSVRLRFGAGLRFEESELDGDGEVTETRSGGYGYRYTSRTTGELRLDYDGGKTCEVRLTFRGVGAGSYSFRCGGRLGGQGNFRMSGLNRGPEITSAGAYEVAENRARVGRIEAMDGDDEIGGYGIAGGADGGLFAVVEETGELMFREAPDYEDPSDVESAEPASGAADNEYIVVVEVRSGEGERERKGQRAIRVRVSDEEEPPEITSLGPFEVAENQARVGQLEAVDQDKQDEITGYGIAGGADGALFAVEAETGELMFREAPDYETPGDVESEEPQSTAADNEYIVVVEVSSGEGERERKGSRAIRVRVSDEEEPPGAPAAPVVTAEGSDSLKVSWREPENRGPEITDYEVRYREEGEAGYSDGGHEGTGLEVRLSGLEEGTVYEVQVRAVNQEGMSEWSEPGEGRTGMEEADPDDPSDFTGEDLKGRRLTLRLEGEEGAAGSLELRFGEGNRFEQIESGGQQAATRAEGASRSGSYTYEKTGPLMGTVRLDYDDGSSCEIRLSFTESGVGAFSYGCGEGDAAEGSFRLTTGSQFVPVILSAAGQNQSFFTSELTLTNRGEKDVRLDYSYTANRGGGSGTASEVLGAGMQTIETDALGHLQSLGIPIPQTGNRIGTLRVEVRLGSEVKAVVRTTTVVPEGRAGLAYLGVAEEEGFDEAVYLCGLRQNGKDRSNVAFQNMGAPEEGAITVRTTVYSGEAADATARVLKDVTLEPGGFHQYSGLLGVLGVPAQGYVKVERVEGTASFYAYGVINDQANSDGSFVFPVTASSLEEKPGQTLPVIVETSEFTSELTVTNFSEEPRTLDFQFVSEQVKTDGKTAGFSMTLEAGRQQIIPDLVEELRGQVAGLGSSRGFYAGPLFVVAEEGDMSGIVIGARTGSEGGGGSYSVFYNAVPEGEAFSREAWVDGLQQNQENRSNLALVNTGEVDGSPSVFHLEIYDGETGLLAETVVTKPIPARGWHQINGILSSYAPETRQGYIRIEKVSGENPFLAYGVVNDGGAPGERSGDGAYLPARE